MNKWVPLAGIFLAGAGLGGLGVWLGVKKHYTDRANEEIDAVVARYSAMAKRAAQEDTAEVVSVLQYELPEITINVADIKVVEKIDYARISAEPVPTSKPQTDTDGWKIISEEEYYDTHEDWVKNEFVYYSENDALVGENEDEVIERERWLGRAGVTMMQTLSGSTMLFVRNYSVQEDFSILVIDESFVK